MKATITLTILIFTTFIANAQYNLKPGSVTYRDGTTHHGLIDYKEWGLNPEYITFQDEKGNKKLTPKELNAFVIDGVEAFESAIVSSRYSGYIKTTEISPTSVVLVGKPSEIRNDTVFLRRTISGRLFNLYQWENINTTKYFVKNNVTGELSELIIDIHFNPDRPEKKIITRKYIGQFNLLAQDPQALNKDKVTALLDAQLPYKESSFRILINMLNGSEEEKEPEMLLSPYAGLALQGSQVSYSGEYSLLGTTKMSLYPALNAGLDLYPNRHVKRFRIRFNLGFSGGSYTTRKDSSNASSETMAYTYKMTQYTLSFSTMLVFNFYNTPALKINAASGLTVNYSFYRTNDFSEVRTYYGITNESKIQYEMQPMWVSAPIRGGVTLAGRFDLFAQYNISLSSLTNMVYRSIKASGFQLGINYCF